ncbi:MAG: D-beta-D-heptose 1-phosphate adenosyltransferase [Deltaproteobacteria bacterium SG8_13]|nr:MAG: D-beta-D-heptose 1-phosphate adenosyltransferase [Deltaproteobacteria bacterium SG8_13]
MTLDISKFQACKVLVVGDLMIDEYVWGSVDRISPEAPVQVVAVTDEDYTLGGAGNVVNNLSALGAAVQTIGVIGTDTNGSLLLKKLKRLKAGTAGVIAENNRPTTVKTRILADHQHVLRIDRETRREIAGDTFTKLSDAALALIPAADVVLVSDYGKGLITAKFLAHVIRCARQNHKPVIVDPKGDDYTRYNGASLVTPNRKEAAMASGVEIVDEATLQTAGKNILKKTDIERVLITLGKDGMVLFERNTKPYKIAAEARLIFDVSGAGDTVVAVLSLSLAAGADYRQAMTLANTAAGLVVGKVGTATASPAELQAALDPSTGSISGKFVPMPSIKALARDLKRAGKKIVMTNGCFDLLHSGHIALLSEAKKRGDVLIVAIDDDASVRRVKGAGRPVLSEGERTRILAALDVVDYVTVFATDRLTELIEHLRPDVLTKGSNYKHETVFGHEIVEKHGGRIVLIPIDESISATGIINKIKKG